MNLQHLNKHGGGGRIIYKKCKTFNSNYETIEIKPGGFTDSTNNDNKRPWFSKTFESGSDLSKLKLKMNWKDQGGKSKRARLCEINFSKLDRFKSSTSEWTTVDVNLPKTTGKVINEPSTLEYGVVKGTTHYI